MMSSVRDTVNLLSNRVDILESGDMDALTKKIIRQIDFNQKQAKQFATDLDQKYS